jgi:hypothetical protein
VLEALEKLAHAIRILRLPSIVIGTVALISALTMIFNPALDDRYLMPSVIALLWAMCSYFFIVTFCSIPTRPDDSLPLFSKLKQKVGRGWYWLIGVMFIITTLSAIAVTYRMILIWLKDYAG